MKREEGVSLSVSAETYEVVASLARSSGKSVDEEGESLLLDAIHNKRKIFARAEQEARARVEQEAREAADQEARALAAQEIRARREKEAQVAAEKVEQAKEELRTWMCLCPVCPFEAAACGLCRKHYMKVNYYKQRGFLTQDWLVLHKRIHGTYGFVPRPDSLETLPVFPKRQLRGKDMLWLFDWPESGFTRERLEAEKEKESQENRQVAEENA